MIAKEIERAKIPVAQITAMSMMGKQTGTNRVVTGNAIPYPCGDPSSPADVDLALRRGIVECALHALQTKVDGPTVFMPEVTYA